MRTKGIDRKEKYFIIKKNILQHCEHINNFLSKALEHRRNNPSVESPAQRD